MFSANDFLRFDWESQREYLASVVLLTDLVSAERLALTEDRRRVG